MDSGTLLNCNPADLVESATNPRTGEVDVSDLLESVKAQGILEPLLGRVLPTGQIEVVCGKRRRAAALCVGLDAVPVLVRDMTDAEALEIQIVENRDRKDVHPLAEAEAYERLLAMPKPDGSTRTPADIAARCGVSMAYLTRRMALLGLGPEARDAFTAGRIETSVALVVATLRKADQKKAVLDVAAPEDGTRGAVPYRAALEHIRRTYLLRLSEAPFPISSDDLVPGVGACPGCPKRTGSNPDLFGSFDESELCTDPACHAKKSAAGWARLATTAEAQGREVLSDKAAGEIFRFGASTPAAESGYVDLDDKCMDDPKERTYRELLGDSAPPALLARDGSGGVHDLLPAKEAKKAARAALPKAAAEKAEEVDAQEVRNTAAEAEEKIRDEMYRLALEAFRPHVAKAFPARVAAEALIQHARETRKAWKLDDEGTVIAALKGGDLAALVLEASLECVGAHGSFMRAEPGPIEAVAKAYGVDLEKIRATVEGRDEPKKEKPAAKKKAPAKKKPAAKK